LTGSELESFNRILENIYRERGVDFRQYRPRCLRRRILVAMHAHNLTRFADYLNVLKANPQEYEDLLNRITINVSEFLRNPETFKTVRELILPPIIEQKKKTGGKIVRIWSAGCATGEEPYSIAIMIKEMIAQGKEDLIVSIFATDIDDDALAKAAEGVYEQKAFRNLKAHQIKQFLESLPDARYRIKPELKEMIKFSHHNMISDLPLSRIDIVFCRNVVIYFNRELQRKVYQNFHKGLNKNGFLVAGKVETIMGIAEDIFDRLDYADRIFKKKIILDNESS